MLLSLSLEQQESWVREQSWFKNKDFTEFVVPENVIAMAVNIQDDLEERIENFQDYNNSGFLDFGQVSEQRFAELEGEFTKSSSRVWFFSNTSFAVFKVSVIRSTSGTRF